MFRNFLRSSLRVLKSNYTTTFLNTAGLAIGIAVFLFIQIYASWERSFDQFHENADNIYRIEHIRKRHGQEPYRSAATFPGLAPVLQSEFPEIEQTCRVVPVWGRKGLIIHEDEVIPSSFVNYADDSFFQLFSFPLLQGNPETVLRDAHTAVLSSEMAAKLFKDMPAIGKRIKMKTRDGVYNFEVTGIFDGSLPSHIKSDILLSFKSLYSVPGVNGKEIENNWLWVDYPTYFRVRPGTDLATLDEKFVPIIDKYGGERNGSAVTDFDIQSLTSIHLNSNLNQEITVNGDGQIVQFLVIIGFFTLAIAFINYVNLYTAKISERAREVGIRKTLGAGKLGLAVLFLMEAAITNLVALLIAVTLLLLTSPVISQLSGLNLEIARFGILKLGGMISWLWLTGTLCCGLYPSLVVSNINPLHAFMQPTRKSRVGRLRHILVVFQFAVASGLMGGLFVVGKQLHFMNNKALGINIENMLILDVHNYERGEYKHAQKVNSLKIVLSKFSGVSGVAFSSDVVGEQVAWRGSSSPIGQNVDPTDRKIVYKMTLGPDYLRIYDTHLLAGRHFAYHSDSSNVILNEAALKLYGYESPEEVLHKRIKFSGVRDTSIVVGVIEDFYQESLREGIKPTAYLYFAPEISRLSVRLDQRSLPEFLRFAKAEFERFFPQAPFEYHLIDEVIASRHQMESKFFMLFNFFTVIAIFIALLGLIGLSYFMANQRVKEMGIRKVLGSGISAIILLMFKDFIKLIIIGNLLALPILYFTAQEWLNSFAFRIEFDWAIPLISMILSIVFAFACSFLNLLKLANVNPADVLKQE